MHEKNFNQIQIETEKILKEMIIQIERVSEKTVYKESKKQLSMLKSEQDKLQELEFTFAMIGTMKAGKSTTINAIVGQEILPHRVEAMTTLPTLVTHKLGQKEPILYLAKKDVFEKLVLDIKNRISNELSGEFISSESGEFISSESGEKIIAAIKSNIVSIKEIYKGKEEIFTSLKLINDLMRLANAVEVEPPYAEFQSIHDFPRIEVEFYYLRDKDALKNAKFSLLDTPGPNEYGQSRYLKEISQVQTEQASAVMLVVDYTQISGESSAGIKQQVIDALQYIGKDKVFILLNKFDEDRKQSNEKGYDGAREYFAKTFLEGNFNSNNVFPISSRDAFYANLGLNELAINNKIDEKLSWVKEFGEIIIGRRWKKKINNIAEVKEDCEDAYEDSYFDAPMKNIINQSYDKAQFGSVESALNTLDGVFKKIKNLLNTNVDSLSVKIETLNTQINVIKKDTEKIKNISKLINKKTDEKLMTIDNSINDALEKKLELFSNELSSIFKSTIEDEREKKTYQTKEEVEKKHKERWKVRFFDYTFGKDALENKQNKRHKEIIKQFEELLERGEIQFEKEEDKNSFIEAIKERINEKLNQFANESQDMTVEEISCAIREMNAMIDSELQDVIKEIKNNLGKNVVIDTPNIQLENMNFDTKINIYESVTKSEKDDNQNQEGTWGKLKRMVDFFDCKWGINEGKKDIFIVSKNKIQDEIDSAINN